MSNPTTSPRARSPSAELADIFDSLLDSLQAGDDLDLEACVAEHPEHAEKLRQLFPTMKSMAQLGRSHSHSHEEGLPDFAGSETYGGTLGDYQIVREVGRGGMGCVYDAVQISLNRRVALKVLPFAAVLDPRQLQRFKNEAQAAAKLHHTNIVPVYSVGNDRGVHFYAMQFIDGQSLAEVIEDLRAQTGLTDLPACSNDSAAGPICSTSKRTDTRPKSAATDAIKANDATTRPSAALSTERPSGALEFFRTAARLGVQAAEALEHAHQDGVVHRDIKPSNLLLDTRGKVWITDFGLARVHGEVGLTMSGDVLGTLRYMSPEQALSKPGLIDHRTDVYSLGATLYELIALRPVFPGQDRQELLRRIAFDEPRPLRTLNRSVPIELETIITKALGKTPVERYESAQELADDLKRFLDGRPILAKRPTLLVKATKLARRHKATFATIAAAGVLGLIGLAVSLVLITRERDLARSQEQRATTNLRLASRALDEIYTDIVEKGLLNHPQSNALKRELLEKVLGFYEQFASANRDDAEVRIETARATAKTAVILQMLGQYEKAEHANRQAIRLFEELAAQFPQSPEHRRDAARSHGRLAGLYSDTGRWAECEQEYRNEIAIFNELIVAHPDDTFYRDRLAVTYSDLGVMYRRTRRPQDAETVYLKAKGIWSELIAADAKPEYKEGLAAALANLANVYSATDRAHEAETAYVEALRLRDELATQLKTHRAKFHLAQSLINLGSFYRETGRSPQAEPNLRAAYDLTQSLVHDHPDVIDYVVNFGAAALNFGNWTRDHRDANDAVLLYGEAVTHLESVLKLVPELNEGRRFLSLAHRGRAQALSHKLKRHADALPDWDRAIELDDGTQRTKLRTYRAASLAYLPDHVRATTQAREIAATDSLPGDICYNLACVFAISTQSARADDSLPQTECDRLAQNYGARAVELLEKADSTGFFARPGRTRLLADDSDLQPIRSREDFQELMKHSQEKR